MPFAKTCVALMLCLALAACSGQESPEGEVSAADQVKAAALLDSYESARSGENWEAAEATAEQLRDKFPDSEAAAKLAPTLAQVREQAEQAREHRRLSELWNYQTVAIGTGVQRSATLYSHTAVAEEGVVAATPDAQLVLRDHPSWGRSVYLLLELSRFECGKPCAMQISFDDGEAQRFAGRQADSGSGPALFIEEDKRFIEAMSQAKKVRIKLPKGSARIPALTFEVAGYAPSRFEAQ